MLMGFIADRLSMRVGFVVPHLVGKRLLVASSGRPHGELGNVVAPQFLGGRQPALHAKLFVW